MCVHMCPPPTTRGKSFKNRPRAQPDPKKRVGGRSKIASWLQDGPRWPQDGPKMSQDGPKMAQDGPKMAPRWLKMVPRRPQDGPRWPQEGPEMAQDSPNMVHWGGLPLRYIRRPCLWQVTSMLDELPNSGSPLGKRSIPQPQDRHHPQRWTIFGPAFYDVFLQAFLKMFTTLEPFAHFGRF